MVDISEKIEQIFNRVEGKKFFTYILITTVLLLSGATSTRAQTTEGTEFWLTFGKGYEENFSNMDMQIKIVSNDQPVSGNIYFTNLDTSVPFNIGAFDVYKYNLDDTQKQASLNLEMGTSYRSIRITTNEQVTVYARNNALYTTDATNVLPLTALGTNYYHFSYTPFLYELDAYAVIAIQNNTDLYHNGNWVATLNAGQVYYRTQDTDMTGAHITSNRPVAFFAVNQMADIRITTIEYNIGNLKQQLPPVNTWGKNFFVPASHLSRNIVRIVASEDNTTITQTGGTMQFPPSAQAGYTINAGQFIELEISSNDCFIQANRPIGVCAYLVSPAQIWLPAIEQTVTNAIVSPFIINTSYINDYFIIVITSTDKKNETMVSIEGAPPTTLSGGNWMDNADADMSFYIMPLVDPSALFHFTNNKGLIVMCYGVDERVAYYFLAHSSVRTFYAGFFANDIYCKDLPTHYFCTNNIEFRANIEEMSSEPGSFSWYIDSFEAPEARDKIEWSRYFPGGSYEIKMIFHPENGSPLTVEATLNIGVHISATASPIEAGNIDGIGCYKIGEDVNLKVTPNVGYVFKNWTKGDTEISTETSFTFTATEDVTLVANFIKEYTVSVIANPTEGGEVEGGGIYLDGDNATVSATPNEYYKFVNWIKNGNTVSINSTYLFEVTEDIVLVANFESIDYIVDFDTYAHNLWNNTFMLNLKKLAEDGYEVTGCLWFKNGIEETDTQTINEFSYSAGPNKTDLLELSPTYYMFILITENHGNLCSSKKVLNSNDLKNVEYDMDSEDDDNLIIYPNPVKSGESFTIEGINKGVLISIFNQTSINIHNTVATGNSMPFTINLPAGIYFIRADDKVIKLVVVI